MMQELMYLLDAPAQRMYEPIAQQSVDVVFAHGSISFVGEENKGPNDVRVNFDSIDATT